MDLCPPVQERVEVRELAAPPAPVVIQGELSRFDFHVLRFLHSEDVLAMTATEVGQLVLLFCQAWMLGKEATLPDDPPSLARWCRSDSVSPLVLSKFVPRETRWGRRLHSPRLSLEWAAATERLERYSMRGKAGAEARARAAGRARDESVAKSYGKAHTNPNQINPNQSSSDSVQVASYQENMIGHLEDQSNSGQTGVTLKEDLKAKDKYSFARFKKIFELCFDEPPTDSMANRRLYFDRCKEFGERGVLTRLVDWGSSHQDYLGGDWQTPAAAGWKFLHDEDFSDLVDFSPQELTTCTFGEHFDVEALRTLFLTWFGG